MLEAREWDRPVRLSFSAFLPGDEYINQYEVVVNADRLSASVPVISNPEGYGLPGFIQALSDDFRGWSGVRSWRSLEDQLRVEATWQSGGHVKLVFHLTPSVYDSWTLSVEFVLEAGEELQTLGVRLAAFMTE